MGSHRIGSRTVAAFAAAMMVVLGQALLAAAALAHPHEGEEERGKFVPHAAGTPIQLDEIVFASDGTVSGVVVNRGADAVRDVRLLVRYVWHWADEQKPGEYSPASSTYFTVSEEIPALGSRPFRFSPSSPLPIRADGYFAPTVEVADFTLLHYEEPPHRR